MTADTLIMIDDTDSGINYSAGWITDKGSHDSMGNSGAPYESTSHYTKGTGSFSYTFSGTYVGIVGSDLSRDDPSRTCTVDGQTIPNYNLTFGLNFVTHCEINGLTDGKHTIEVTVTTTNPDGYWFDFLMYIPSASVSRTNATLMIDSDDSSMTYGSGWTPNAPGYIATQSGATMSIQFTGRTLTWLGFYLSQLPAAPTTGTYSVDGGSSFTFDLDGSAAQTTGALFNQRFFTTGLLPAGQHTIKVTYNGNSSTVPLSLYNVIVQNGDSAGISVGGSIGASIPATATVNSGGGSGTTTTQSGSSGVSSGEPSTLKAASKSHSHVGAIVGVVIGFVVLLLVFLLSFLRRRNHKRHGRVDTSNANNVQPFTSPPTEQANMPQPPHTPNTSLLSRDNNASPQLSSDNKRPVPVGIGGAGPVFSEARNAQHLAPNKPWRASQPTHQPSVSTCSSPATDSSGPTESEVVVLHEDSGVRLPDGTVRPGVTVVEMPPTYSAT
ncbi:hypothetical protein BJ912DRAFT_1056459 [Pholiota molesta]|nr:hypothetical protein BJ912DRAFT_1056459 [Pholiota molesta]